MKNPNRFYVYVFYRDTTMLRPFYVGKGCEKRFKVSQKYDIKWPRKKKNMVVAECLEKYGYVPAKKIATGLTELDAFRLEIHWIAFYGRADKGLGILTNGNDGGHSASGRIVSELEREKKSLMFSGRKLADDVRDRLVARNKSIVYTEEMRRAMSERAKGRTWTDAQRVAASKQRKGRLVSKEIRRKQAETMRKIATTPEWQMRLKTVHTGRKRSKETCRKISEKAKARAKTAVGRAHLLKITQEYPKAGLPKRRRKCDTTT